MAPRRESRPSAGRRAQAVLAGSIAVLLVGATIAACGHAGSSDTLGRLTVSGVVQYAPAGGSLHSAGSGQLLKAGDQVRVTTGSAVIRLVPDGVLELRDGTAVTISKVSRLTAGGLLITPSGHPVHISAANATLLVPSGAAQLIDAGLSGGLTAKVYRDRATLQIPGNPDLGITAPRQATLTIHSLLPIPATPLQYSDADSWDRRFLATAEAFSRQLTAAATGFNAQLSSSQAHDAAYYQRLLPDLVTSQVAPSLQAQSAPVKPGDDLIALALAMRGRRGAFGDRMRQELDFKSQGADWGLVALDQGVTDLGPLLNDVLAAIDRASQAFTTPGSGEVAFGPPLSIAPPTTVAGRGRTGSRTTPTTSPPRPAVPNAVVATPPTTIAPLLGHLPQTGTVLDPLLDPLIDPLIDALNRILAGRP